MFIEGPTLLRFILSVLAMLFAAAPAVAEVEQCRFIQAKPEREACYQRQEAELAAKRKPEKPVDTTTTGFAEADAPGRRGGLPEPAQHLPGLLRGGEDPPSARLRGELKLPHALPARQLPARFSANEASPSEASAVWRRAACIRTSRA